MKIRRATIEDISCLARIHLDSWNQAYRGLVPDSCLEGFTFGKRKARFEKSIAEGKEETYVVESDDALLGFAAVGECRDCDVDVARVGEIWGIYVAPEYWRKGAGRALAQHAQGVLAHRGLEEATLWVLEENDGARKFYEHLGFTLDGGKKTVTLGEPLPTVRYRKRLRSAEQDGGPEA